MKRLFLIVVCVLLTACATHIKLSESFNPPPTEAFSAFDHFELKPVTLSPEYSGSSANQKAAAKIQENFDHQVKPVLDNWNARGKSGGKTLLIEPHIEQIKFINGGARFFVGAIAGSSAVIMKVKYTEADSGKIVAYPEFYQKANAYIGALTFGAQDNSMLSRIVTLVAEYNARNFSTPVGGATRSHQ